MLSSVLVAINILVMSAYSDSKSVEVPTKCVDEEEEDGLDSDRFLAQRSQKMCFGQFDNDTDRLGLCLFWEVQEWLLVNLLVGPEEQMKMKWPLTLVLRS